MARIYSNQIENRNFLSPIGFKFTLSKTPKVTFFSNSSRIPEISLGTALQPSYLKDIDFISEEEAERSKENAIGLLMKQALEGVVAVPWTLMLDKWRMAVFDGNLSDDQLNDYWWELREKYQGVASPIERPVDAFYPGAK